MTGDFDWTDPFQAGRVLIEHALAEDHAREDAATEALGPMGNMAVTCSVNARQKLIVAGIDIAALVFQYISSDVKVSACVSEGKEVSPGTTIAVITGTASSILRGERVFLNILGRLCGIATLTGEYVRLTEGTGVEILDTRKTTPGLRALEKYAVRTGGGVNHRFSLADMAMLKDNHLAAIGGVANLAPVMERLRSTGIPVEIEVDSLDQLRRIIHLAPDRILLDNMGIEKLKKAVETAGGKGIYLEASGGINADTVRAVAGTGVNGISVGALTHSVKSADIGLDWVYHGGDNDKTGC